MPTKVATRNSSFIRSERDAQLSPERGAPDARLANLVAYEQRIAAAPTWPFDLSTLLRFALYVSLGLGSCCESMAVNACGCSPRSHAAPSASRYLNCPYKSIEKRNPE